MVTPVKSTRCRPHGSIIRIKLDNFLTYTSVEISPGPNLNVVLGPNGTGKSSIVCAIALGLAAKPSILGRAKDPVDYIKHEQQSAYVEIELHNENGRNYTIGREIRKTSGGEKDRSVTNWFINNHGTTAKVVEQLVTSLNIQLDNLCQFLPQEKVAEFTKMSPQELLENTEKAVGGLELWQRHQCLMNEREDLRELEQEVRNLEESLERDMTANQRLQTDVDNHRKRQLHIERIKNMNMCRPWLVHQAKAEQCKALQSQKAQIQKEMAEEKVKVQPVYTQRKNTEAALEKLEVDINKCQSMITQKQQSGSNQKREMEKFDEQIQELVADLAARKKEEEKREKNLREMKKHVEDFKEQLESCPVVPPNTVEQIAMRMKDTNAKVNKAREEYEQLAHVAGGYSAEIKAMEKELQRLKDKENQKLENLRKISGDSFSAVKWLRENEHQFKRTVHEPILTLINVHDPKHAKYVEKHIAMKDLRAFVCETDEDVRMLTDELKNLNINVVLAPPDQEYYPKRALQHYKPFGFHSFLRELFTCPLAVMRYLCKQYNVHTIPVGTSQTEKCIEQILRTCPELYTFYTSDQKFSVRRSKYTGDFSTMTTELGPARLLMQATDVDRVKELDMDISRKKKEKQNLASRTSTADDKVKNLNKDLENLRVQKKNFSEQIDKRRTLLNKIRMKEENIRSREEEGFDLNDLEMQAVKQRKKLLGHKMAKLELMKTHFLAAKEEIKKLSLLNSQQAQKMKELGGLAEQERAASHHLKQLMQEQEDVEKKLEDEKRKCKRLLEEAKSTTNTDSITPALREMMCTIPNDIDKLDAEIHAEQARADLTAETDSNVLKEFDIRQKRISQGKNKLDERRKKLETHLATQAEARDRWLQPLQSLLHRISENFSFFFDSLDCAGEVDLYIPPNNEDYRQYGIRIRVMYREDETLQDLTSSYQSGGEKSVATVLYMLALQELTRCPIRCVDEINQGMDPINERKIFQLVSKTACREGTSQYFLLSPKLLPELEYSSRMTFLFINNGPFLPPDEDWSISSFISRRKELANEQWTDDDDDSALGL